MSFGDFPSPELGPLAVAPPLRPTLPTFFARCCPSARDSAPATASAKEIHAFSTSFAPTSGFFNPLGVAIDRSTEEVYIADISAGFVYLFEASGSPDPTTPKLTEEDGVAPFLFVSPFSVAVDNSAGPNKRDVYVSDYGTDSVSQFGPSGTRTTQAAITGADVLAEVAVQSDPLPAVVNSGDGVLDSRPNGMHLKRIPSFQLRIQSKLYRNTSLGIQTATAMRAAKRSAKSIPDLLPLPTARFLHPAVSNERYASDPGKNGNFAAELGAARVNFALSLPSGRFLIPGTALHSATSNFTPGAPA